MNLTEYVKSLPLEDQLPEALRLIESLSGQHDFHIAHLMGRYKLSKLEAQVLLILNRRFPSPVNKHVLHTSLYGSRADGGPDLKIIDVIICKIRIKGYNNLPAKIETIHGLGYQLSGPIPLPDTNPIPPEAIPSHSPQLLNRSQPWTDEERAELKKLIEVDRLTGWEVALKLGRTERACMTRYHSDKNKSRSAR